MKAILSDIHGNLEALKAVLNDIKSHHVREIYCLGDIMSHGPNPLDCLDIAMGFRVVLLGDDDQEFLLKQAEPGQHPASNADQSRERLEETSEVRLRWKACIDYLAKRPRSFEERDFLFVHASPTNPLDDYIFPEDIYNQPKMERIFRLSGRYCFHGHSHVPGVITENLEFHSPESIDFVYQMDARKILCDVGSVGQPRDGDWRACYVLLAGHKIRFRRVEYDIDTTVKKLK